MELCFICNTQSDDGLKLNKVKSQHTDTRIIDLLKKILGDFKTKRTIDSEENCICSDCLLGLGMMNSKKKLQMISLLRILIGFVVFIQFTLN